MAEYWCWNPENNADPEEWHRVIAASRPEYAAEKFLEWEHSQGDYVEEMVVAVRDPETGETTRWTVYAEPSVEYRARPLTNEGDKP